MDIASLLCSSTNAQELPTVAPYTEPLPSSASSSGPSASPGNGPPWQLPFEEHTRSLLPKLYSALHGQEVKLEEEAEEEPTSSAERTRWTEPSSRTLTPLARSQWGELLSALPPMDSLFEYYNNTAPLAAQPVKEAVAALRLWVLCQPICLQSPVSMNNPALHTVFSQWLQQQGALELSAKSPFKQPGREALVCIGTMPICPRSH